MDAFSTPFQLRYIHFFVVAYTTPSITSTPHNSVSSTIVGILFKDQNNLFKGKSIVHITIGHPGTCGMTDTWRYVAYSQQHGTAAHIPLPVVLQNNKLIAVHITETTKTLTKAAQITESHVIFTPREVNTRSVCSGRDMALLLACIDNYMIRLV